MLDLVVCDFSFDGLSIDFQMPGVVMDASLDQ
jgi:hypothetical protein